ncbi:MAG TPA: dicarboxylate/amino acid:cation symporter [Gemmatimonadales bacterium]|nr:dicarboxylate/amino acid:cation symporter [Gemmatimonadales bacterium]
MKLHTKILLGLVLGAAAGVIANVATLGQVAEASRLMTGGASADSIRALTSSGALTIERANQWVMNPVGQVFLRMLFMTVIPLVFASLTLGVAGLGDIRRVGKLGSKTVFYFLASTALAATVGLVMVNVIEPGTGLTAEVRDNLMETYRTEASERMAQAEAADFGVDTFVAIVPRNPVQAAADLDMLGIIFFSLVFGSALTLIPKEKSEPVIRFLDGVGEAVVKIIGMAMKIAPYGVFGLIFVVTSRFGFALLKPLGLFVLTVLGGLLFHTVVNLSLIHRFLSGLNPWTFFNRAKSAIITAFSTSSSSATLPTALKVAEDELGISPKVAGFVLPLGSTMCMNGTALFEGVVVLFLAQVVGMDLSIGTQIVVIVLAVLTAVGAAGVPGGSIPLLVLVLETVNIPGEYIAIVIGVDRLLDMCRTTVNVAGDLTATCIVARWEGGWNAGAVGQGGGQRAVR